MKEKSVTGFNCVVLKGIELYESCVRGKYIEPNFLIHVENEQKTLLV